jgi:two-component sensor histidine kinase
MRHCLNMRLLGLVLCFAGCLPAHALNKARIDSLQRVLKQTSGDTARARLMLALASTYKPEVVTQQFYYANEALALSDKADWDNGRMLAEQFIGDSYNDIQSYDDALVHYKKCLTLARKLKHKGMEAYCLQLLFHVYNKQGDLSNALSDQKELVDLVDKQGDPRKICDQRSAYAICLSDNGKHREAIDCQLRDVTLAKAKFDGNEEKDMVAGILNSLSLVYIRTKQTDSALYCLWTAAANAKQTGNFSLETYINSSFCDVYSAAKNYDSAIIYGLRTVKMAETIKDIDLEQQYSKALSKLYEAKQQPALALYFYQLSDSLLNVISTAQKMVDKAMEVTRINLEQQAEHSRQEKKALEADRRNQQAILVLAISVLAALTALTLFIYRNLRNKQKANRTISQQAASLQEQNVIIDRALKDKEMLLKETHHRVKNNLQLISSLLELQAAGVEDETAKEALRKAQDRVLSIATVHSKLYGSTEDESIEFSAFVSDLFGRLDSAFGRGQHEIDFKNTIPVTHVPLNTVVLLGIILNELITNSYKHAFANTAHPEISIGFEQSGNNYVLRYYDNGPGLGEGVFNTESGSLGLYLVRRLSRQLKGSAEYKYEAGSTFTITFPYAAN